MTFIILCFDNKSNYLFIIFYFIFEIVSFNIELRSTLTDLKFLTSRQNLQALYGERLVIVSIITFAVAMTVFFMSISETASCVHQATVETPTYPLLDLKVFSFL